MTIERNNIERTIGELFGGNYNFVVPLYQRNFAWGENEITQLMQDLYESYQDDKGKLEKTYFVGSIIYISRNDTDNQLEVIDGQQRLTAFTLLINVLGKELLPQQFTSKLKYDSREEVQQYLNNLYSGLTTNNSTAAIDTFKTAVQTIETCTLDPKKPEKEENSIAQLKEKNPEKLRRFTEYISSNVYFVLAEMPQDTDVATYFEIMNNTGEQLQKHEIVKSLILGSAQDRLNVKELESLAMIWDACSQMDLHVQKAIPSNKRELLFGENFNSFEPTNILKLSDDEEEELSSKEDKPYIENIIKEDNEDKYKTCVKNKNENEDNAENNGACIIDFPNFLMHVFRLCYNQEYKKKEGKEIPLNEKDLLSVFDSIKKHEDFKAEDFIQHLLYYRIILDRYMVRRKNINGDEKWSLQYAIKQTDNKNSVRFRNTFGKGNEDEDNKGQDKIIKALSMLQVSYPQRKYKRFLYEILSWFKYVPEHVETSYNLNWYLPKLNTLISHYLNDVFDNYGEELYALGTSTPRFILNVIDYLLYLSSDDCSDFDFKYYNSVEHHLPQSRENYKEECDAQTLDSIGNLFLLSRRVNSSLNDRDPMTKVDKTDPRDKMPPNRKLIYEQTRKNRRWDIEDIKEHTDFIKQLLSKEKETLKVNELEDSSQLYRACLCVKDYCEEDGISDGSTKYDFTQTNNELGLKAKKEIANWLYKHPQLGLEDFIEEQLSKNEELKEDSWRYCFVKYPSVMEYCGNGKFTWKKVEKSSIIYLLPNNRMCNDAHKLREHIINDILEENGIRTFINRYGIGIKLMENNIGDWCYDTESWLHIWVDDNAKHWCYEVCTNDKRKEKYLQRNGWIKNNEGYNLSERPYLCDCPLDYISSIKSAIKSVKEMMELISQI